MSIALLMNSARSVDWQKEILKVLPDTKVEIYPKVEDPALVKFVLAWKPQPDYYTNFPNLKVIQSAGAGVDHLFLDSVPPAIKVCKIVDPLLKKDMFEHVLACLMTSMKNFSAYRQYQSEKMWKPLEYQSIDQTTVTVLGLGEIGGYVAENLVHLGFRVNGWSRSLKNCAGVTSFFGMDHLYRAVEDADFIVNILPLTEQTRGILNKEFFSACRAGTVLVNVGRGAHIVDDDLLEAMAQQMIKEAYLDVFHQEPLPQDHLFWANDLIHMSPHVASRTNISSSVQQVVENYQRMVRNEPLLNVVSPERGY